MKKPRPKTTFPLSWHKENVRNSRRHLLEQESQLARMAENVKDLRARVDFHDAQIAEAERRGMTEFDAERLLKALQARGARRL